MIACLARLHQNTKTRVTDIQTSIYTACTVTVYLQVHAHVTGDYVSRCPDKQGQNPSAHGLTCDMQSQLHDRQNFVRDVMTTIFYVM